jgi:hypothetical protein
MVRNIRCCTVIKDGPTSGGSRDGSTPGIAEQGSVETAVCFRHDAVVSVSQADVARRLTALAAIDLHLDAVLSAEVRKARVEAHMTWKQVGDALGISAARANKRWMGIETRSPDRTGTARSGEAKLMSLTDADRYTLETVAGEVVTEVLSKDKKQSWASVLKSVLVESGIYHRMNRDRRGRAMFHLTRWAVDLVCVEPSDEAESFFLDHPLEPGRRPAPPVAAGVHAVIPALLGSDKPLDYHFTPSTPPADSRAELRDWLRRLEDLAAEPQ